jgi:hypothetical protein
MEGVITAILIGAIIIAVAISQLGKRNEPDNTDDFANNDKGRTADEIRKDIIEEGFKDGLTPKEISTSLWFKTEEKVLDYIKKYDLEDELKELLNKRNKNPNLPKEIRKNELIQRIMSEKQEIKKHEEDFELAKETKDFDESKFNRDMIKYYKASLERENKELEELEKLLKK